MKKHVIILFITILALNSSCSTGQIKESGGNTSLSATEFSQKIAQTPGAQIVDVRTLEEFEKGHLKNAKNIDWNGNDFQNKISQIDKSKPVFVYCLSGARSAAAASTMREAGYKEVYELSGGIMKWRAANLPETTNNVSSSSGMTAQQFDELLNSDKLVLIDFYADWCAPCKKMKPYLEEISKNMKDKVKVISLNVDDNQALCKELKIDALPVLHLYKNKTLIWKNSGYIGKEDVIKQLN